MSASSVVFRFIGDNDSLKRANAEAKAELSSLGKSSDTSATKMQKWGKYGKMAGLALAAGVAAAALAFGKLAVESVQSYEKAAKETLKLSRISGDSAEDASRLRFVMQQVGMTSDDLGNAFIKLSKSTDKIRDADMKANAKAQEKIDKYRDQKDALEAIEKPTAAQLKQLEKVNGALMNATASQAAGTKELNHHGIVVSDTTGKLLPLRTILENASKVFKDMPNGLEKNALAMDLFGKSGANLIPLLNKGSDGIEELMKKSDEYGYTIGTNGVEDLKKNMLAQREASAAWEGAKIQLGQKLQPILTKLSVWFAKELPVAIKWATEHFKTFMVGWNTIKEKAIPIIDQFKDGWHNLGESWDNFVVRFQDGATVMWSAFVEIWEFIKPTMEAIVQVFKGGWEIIAGIISGVWDAIYGIISGAIGVIKGIIEVFSGILTLNWTAAWNGIKDIVSSVWTMIFGILKGAWSIVTGIFNGIVDGVVGSWKLLWSFVGGLVTTVWDGIYDGVVWGGTKVINFFKSIPGLLADAGKGMWNFISDGFTGAVNLVIKGWNALDIGLGPWQIPDWVPFVGGKKFEIKDLFPDIPYLANGAVIGGPTVAMLGDRRSGNPTEVVFPAADPARGYSLLDQAGIPQRGGNGPQVVVNQKIMAYDLPAAARQASNEAVWAWKSSGK